MDAWLAEQKPAPRHTNEFSDHFNELQLLTVFFEDVEYYADDLHGGGKDGPAEIIKLLSSWLEDPDFSFGGSFRGSLELYRHDALVAARWLATLS